MKELFSPLRLNSKTTLSNRLVVCPMTTRLNNPDGTISDEGLRWYERLVQDDYGMVIASDITIFRPDNPLTEHVGGARLAGLTQLGECLNKYPVPVILQMRHGGSPIDTSIPNAVLPHELSDSRIKTITEDFADACQRVEQAGFAGVEIVGVNGYLFAQFFRNQTNLRQDNYGGSLENRVRFAREVVRSCRRKVSNTFLLSFRMGFENPVDPAEMDVDENIQIANWLKEDGLDYINPAGLNFSARSIKYPEQVLLSYLREKINPTLPLIGSGGITTVESAEQALVYGADLVAVGRAAIGNIALPRHFFNRQKLPHELPYSRQMMTSLGYSSEFIDRLQIQLSALNIVR